PVWRAKPPPALPARGGPAISATSSRRVVPSGPRPRGDTSESRLAPRRGATSAATGKVAGGNERPLTPPVERAPRGPFADAVASLSDRALRRLLGARAYLRGCDYVRRHAVGDIVVEDSGARAIVRGTAQTPYEVRVALAPNGISSQCNCPAF